MRGKQALNWKLEKSQFIGLLIIFGLIFVLALALSLLQQRQEVRKKAWGIGNIIFSLNPPSGNFRAGQEFIADVIMTNTAPEAKEIRVSGLELQFSESVFNLTSVSCNEEIFPKFYHPQTNELLTIPGFGLQPNGKIALTCYKPPVNGVATLSFNPGEVKKLGTISGSVKANPTLGETKITAIRAVIPAALPTPIDLSNLEPTPGQLVVLGSYIITGEGVTPTNTPIQSPTPTQPSVNDCTDLGGVCCLQGFNNCRDGARLINPWDDPTSGGCNPSEDMSIWCCKEDKCDAPVGPTGLPTATPTTRPTATLTPIATPTLTPTATPTTRPTATPTATPTTRPTPTNTPIPLPTPTQEPAKGNLNFKIGLQGIVGTRSGLKVKVTLRRPGSTSPEDKITQEVVLGFIEDRVEQGLTFAVFEGMIMNVDPIAWEVLIKGAVHLQKNFGEVTIVADQTTQKDWATWDQRLLAGNAVDFTEPERYSYNKVDIWDYNRLVAQFGPKMPATGSSADFDFDGDVDVFDYNFIVKNFGKAGDE